MKEFDYIIIGRGIAGAVLSLHLKNKGKSVLIIDEPSVSSSSKVAAGLYNPLVFKKLNKIWNADILIPFADKFYTAEEKNAKEKFWIKKELLRIFSSAGEQNDFELLKDQSSYQAYISNTNSNSLKSFLIAPFQTGIVKNCGNLEVLSFLNYHASVFLKNNSLVQYQIDYTKDIFFSEEKWIIKANYTASKLIFAEGWKITSNPYFNFLPLIPAKGEVLTIRCEELPQEYILNGGCFVLPIGNYCFKVGATFNWAQLNDEPSKEGKIELEQKISELINLPFTIIKHEAGVRPSSKDRRPLLGKHPDHKQLYVFNGLGTRGVIMAPWLADQLFYFMEENRPLPADCDILRFKKS